MLRDKLEYSDALRRWPEVWRKACLAAISFTVSGILAGVFSSCEHRVENPAAVEVTAATGQLALAEDSLTAITAVRRQSKPEVLYCVTLRDAPVGSRLALRCDWVDPAGNIVHQNHYSTHEIDKEIWPTHARCRIGPDSPLGTWTVRLCLDGRILHSTSFEVYDGNSPLPAPAPKEKRVEGAEREEK